MVKEMKKAVKKPPASLNIPQPKVSQEFMNIVNYLIKDNQKVIRKLAKY